MCWVGLDQVGLGWDYSLNQSFTDAIEGNIIFITHTIVIVFTNTNLIYQLWIHITPILIVIHTEQFINKVFIKLYIFIIMLSLKNQTLINTRFVVLEYIYSVATLVIFHHVNNLVTENGFNINASLLTQVKLVFCIAGWKFPYIDLILQIQI